MGYETDQRSGSAAVLVAVIVAVLLLGGLVVVGAGLLLFLRVNVAREEAILHQERAMVAEQEARELQVRMREEVDRSRQLLETESGGETARTTRRLAIQLGPGGEIRADGDPVSLADLKNQLQLFHDSQQMVSVLIQSDTRCGFEQIAEIVSACWQKGVREIDISSTR